MFCFYFIFMFLFHILFTEVVFRVKIYFKSEIVENCLSCINVTAELLICAITSGRCTYTKYLSAYQVQKSAEMINLFVNIM